jgi:hypothetical protein
MKRRKINPGKRLRLRIDPADLARFLGKVKVDSETQCWEWTAYCDVDGYGRFSLNGQKEEAHRIAYAVFVRTIPPDRDIDHRCRNRKCVNPWHLRQRHVSANRADNGRNTPELEDAPF